MASIENRLLDPSQKRQALMHEQLNGMSKKELIHMAAERRAKIAAGEPVENDDFEKLFG